MSKITRKWIPPAGWTPTAGWAAPRWDTAEQAKHMPHGGARDWPRVVAATAGTPSVARYWYGFSPDEIKELEMSTICGGLGEVLALRPPGNKLRYIRDVGRVVGASNGEETSWLYVEYQTDGSVHGRPITQDEIRIKRRHQ